MIEVRGFPLAVSSFKGLDERCNRTDGCGYCNYPVRHLVRLLFFAFHILYLYITGYLKDQFIK